MNKKYFSYDYEDGFELHNTEDEARERVSDIMDQERDTAANDGWSEYVTQIMWGEVIIREQVELVEVTPVYALVKQND